MEGSFRAYGPGSRGPQVSLYADDPGWGRLFGWSTVGFIVLLAHVSVVALVQAPKEPVSTDAPAPTAVLINFEPIPTAAAAEMAQTAQSKRLNRQGTPHVEKTDDVDDPLTGGTKRVAHPEDWKEPLSKSAGSARLQAPSQKKKSQGLALDKSGAYKIGRRTDARSKQVAAVNPDAELHEAQRATPSDITGSSGVASEVPSSWKSELLAHLNRYKRYPEAAKAQRLQGTALLSFSLDRRGRVLTFFLARSSGEPALDMEVLAMIERASPVPAPPPEVDDLSLLVPVQFSLR